MTTPGDDPGSLGFDGLVALVTAVDAQGFYGRAAALDRAVTALEDVQSSFWAQVRAVQQAITARSADTFLEQSQQLSAVMTRALAAMQNPGYGAALRRAGDGVAAAQQRMRDLQVQRSQLAAASSPATAAAVEEQFVARARQILADLGGGYRTAGTGLTPLRPDHADGPGVVAAGLPVLPPTSSTTTFLATEPGAVDVGSGGTNTGDGPGQPVPTDAVSGNPDGQVLAVVPAADGVLGSPTGSPPATTAGGLPTEPTTPIPATFAPAGSVPDTFASDTFASDTFASDAASSASAPPMFVGAGGGTFAAAAAVGTTSTLGASPVPVTTPAESAVAASALYAPVPVTSAVLGGRAVSRTVASGAAAVTADPAPVTTSLPVGAVPAVLGAGRARTEAGPARAVPAVTRTRAVTGDRRGTDMELPTELPASAPAVPATRIPSGAVTAASAAAAPALVPVAASAAAVSAAEVSAVEVPAVARAVAGEPGLPSNPARPVEPLPAFRGPDGSAASGPGAPAGGVDGRTAAVPPAGGPVGSIFAAEGRPGAGPTDAPVRPLATDLTAVVAVAPPMSTGPGGGAGRALDPAGHPGYPMPMGGMGGMAGMGGMGGMAGMGGMGGMDERETSREYDVVLGADPDAWGGDDGVPAALGRPDRS